MREPQEGDRVTGAVRLTRVLSRGGMGSVWLARHEGLDTEVVVKFMISSLSHDELNRNRFLREAAAAAKVHSPHVVRIYDHGVSDGGHPFIVMEYLEGEDLNIVLHKRGSLELECVAHIVDQAGRALDAAHRRGIVHRDVKPANIFLIDVGARLPHVKLVDFGVAKAAQMMTLTSTGEMVGTPVYMSPEQIAAEEVDHRSDLWSLGVVAFRAMTGERPFLADTVAAVTYQVVHAPLPHPSDRRPELQRPIDEWFAKACAKAPADRFASAREMADALWEAIGMPQSAPWSMDGVSGEHTDPEAATVADRPGASGEVPPLGAADQPTAGSLRSSVATVPPGRASRWRGIGLWVGIPLALAAGYGIATFESEETLSEPASTAEAPTPEEPGASAEPTSPTASPAPEPTATLSTAPSASASAPAASASVSAKPPRRYPPRPPPVDPNDLGF